MMRMLLGMVIALISSVVASAESPVTVIATPDGGIQPQTLMDAAGTLHLIYFKGNAAEGNLFYVRQPRDSQVFSQPILVNSSANSAVAVGSVRGGQLAIGKGGRVHVVWFGSNQVKDANGTPLCYSRLDDAGTNFEKQRNLMGNTSILDGGGSIAADRMGHVCVVWHALKRGVSAGEKNRRLWIARSADEGKTFAPETPVWDEQTGACACCSTKVLIDQAGHITVMYRSANGGGNRDVIVLTSTGEGKSFEKVMIHPWKVATCPMSTYALAEAQKGVVAAWDTNGQVFFATINLKAAGYNTPQRVSEGTNQKHPAAAANALGEMILVWTEGTGWQKGGALVWQVYDKERNPTKGKGRLERGIPVWGIPTVVATEKGFMIFH